jgi:hypothetical protein
MTVRDLLRKLKRVDPDMGVYIYTSDEPKDIHNVVVTSTTDGEAYICVIKPEGVL